MFFERIKTPGIAHLAYILAKDGEALLVDPARDIERYLAVLRANGLNLRWILETHRQEDFEMGGAPLREATGAEILACDHEITAHADRRLGDGEVVELAGGLSLRALHTPGHTPESMTYAVALDDAKKSVWGVFTGDSLFIGDTGRTDLPDAAKTEENAALLYDQVHEKIFPLGDQALVLPAHGSGSACGGNVAPRDHSTLGLERASNAVAVKSREDFARHKSGEGLVRPSYFRLMEEVNLLPGRPMPQGAAPWLPPADFAERAARGQVVDTRPVEAFAGAHVPGSYSVWQGGLPRYGGAIAEAETPIFLVVEGPEALAAARLALARVGTDNVAGVLAGGIAAWRNAGREFETLGMVSPRGLRARLDDYAVVDVRENGEFESGHIPGAHHVPVDRLESELPRLGLDKDVPVVATCGVGHRGSLGASMLQRQGYRACNLLGGMTAWNALELPLENAVA